MNTGQLQKAQELFNSIPPQSGGGSRIVATSPDMAVRLFRRFGNHAEPITSVNVITAQRLDLNGARIIIRDTEKNLLGAGDIENGRFPIFEGVPLTTEIVFEIVESPDSCADYLIDERIPTVAD